MIKIGITGQHGFVGNHLYQTLKLSPEKYQCIEFDKSFFFEEDLLRKFVSQCDVIVHLAAMNRHPDSKVIYSTNVGLTDKLIEALIATQSQSQVIFSSSTQEENGSDYGLSKKIGREKLAHWAESGGGKLVGMVVPNVFGPFGKPNYNSFISTFCYKLTHNERPSILTDSEVDLIYVGDLVKEIISAIDQRMNDKVHVVPASVKIKVSEVLRKLESYQTIYLEKGQIPSLANIFEVQLFNTFRSFMELEGYFPKKYIQHTDQRGSFVEIIRLEVGGQVSFSTTVPGVTRGNHFHTRKIERFSVIKGKALIQLRKIGSTEVLDFYLDGENPSYVDMPIWYTHNIKNIGEEVLYTNFWINEFYDESDPDTYFEVV
ncbi:polysaccharide biosynthesis C-terminal domain-containing protein [Aquirufa sp. ROCK-SH2]